MASLLEKKQVAGHRAVSVGGGLLRGAGVMRRPVELPEWPSGSGPGPGRGGAANELWGAGGERAWAGHGSRRSRREGEVVEIGLRAALRDLGREEVGFDVEAVPDVLRVKLPLSLVVPQLESGRVVVGVEDVVRGVEERIRPAFARAVPGLRVRIPLSELFHNLPLHVRPGLEPEPEGGMVRQFPTLFSAKATEDRRRIPVPEPESPGGGAAGRRGVLSREPRPGVPGTFPVRPAVPRADCFRRPPQNGGWPGAGQGTAAAFPDGDGDDLGEAISASELQAEPPPEILRAREAAVRPVPAGAKGQTGARIGGGAGAVNGGGANGAGEFAGVDSPAGGVVSIGPRADARMLALQALFPSDGPLTLQHVAERCAALPGIQECVLVADGEVVGSAPGATEFQESIRRKIESLRDFAASLGLSGGGNFTVRSDSGVRSFFLEEGTCVAVVHGDGAFPPGVREALMLTARELGAVARKG